MKLVIVHAINEAEDGCEFEHFFSTTPGDLVQAGIFSQIATPQFYSGEFRKLSVSLISESFASNSSFGSKASSKTKQGGIDLKNLGIGSGRSGDVGS